MNIQEAIVGPIYFILILLFAYSIRTHVGDVDMQKHFLRGLLFKLIGAFGIYMLYFHYYNGGDTTTYFRKAVYMHNLLFDQLFIGLKVMFSNPEVYDYDTDIHFQSLTASDTATFLVAKFCTITNIFCFNSYIANAFFFATLSYFGIWKMFQVFLSIYPDKRKELAYSFLYIPSVFFWGSGVLKDSLTIGFLGLIIYGMYHLFILRKDMILSILYLISGIYVIGIIKSYILLAFMPAAIIWVFLTYREKIQSKITKQILTPFFFVLIIAGGYGVLTVLGNTFHKFSLDTLEGKAKGMQQWHTKVVEVYQGGEGSSYNLGIVEFTPTGIMKKIPAAINVSLFRPWPWEARNFVMIIESAESTVFMLIAISMMFYYFKNIWAGSYIIVRNPTIIFLFVFSFIFAFSVGFTSYNFGALSRYRIPLLPFFLSAILLLRSQLVSYDTEQRIKKKMRTVDIFNK